MAKIHLAPLDTARDFIAQRDFLCRGKTYRKNDKFEPESVTKRTLRLLYEGRSIGYPDDGPTLQHLGRARPRPKPPAAPVLDQPQAGDKAAEPVRMSDAEKADLIAGNARPALVQMAAKLRIRVTPRMSKADLVDEIARVRDGASHG